MARAMPAAEDDTFAEVSPARLQQQTEVGHPREVYLVLPSVPAEVWAVKTPRAAAWGQAERRFAAVVLLLP